MKLFLGQIFDDYSILDKEQSKHAIKVLRLNIQDVIYVTDGKGKAIKGQIIESNNKIKTNIITYLEANSIITDLHIAIAPTKNIDRFDFFLEKACELGVKEITPIITHNSERKNLNSDKIQKQIISACKQSLRFNFLKINELTKFDDFIKNCDPNKTAVCHCSDSYNKTSINNINNNDISTFLIGPEGDFSDLEIQKLNQINIQNVSLGTNRLRTETAGILIANYFYYNNI